MSFQHENLKNFGKDTFRKTFILSFLLHTRQLRAKCQVRSGKHCCWSETIWWLLKWGFTNCWSWYLHTTMDPKKDQSSMHTVAEFLIRCPFTYCAVTSWGAQYRYSLLGLFIKTSFPSKWWIRQLFINQAKNFWFMSMTLCTFMAFFQPYLISYIVQSC